MNILTLLVGSNPLPNYVVANYLLNEEREDTKELFIPEKVLLVHSKETEIFANSISEMLGKDRFQKIDLKSNERNLEFIRKEITKTLESLKPEKVHLNYTGGTKPMAVNAFNAVFNFMEKKENIIMSDLDPNNYKLTVESSGKSNSYPLSGDLRDWVKLTIKNIVALHNMKDINEDKEDKKETGVTSTPYTKEWLGEFKNEALENINILKDLLNKYDEEKSKNSKLKYNPKEKFIKEKSYYENINLFKLSTVEEKFEIEKDGKLVNQRNFVEFLTGKWLEHYIFRIIIELQKENENLKSRDRKMGMELKSKTGNREMEIDLLLTKGYQLFLFTCTTSTNIKTVKQKGFEALFRAEQLGGEHAKVVVVSLINKSGQNSNDELQDDFEQFDAKGKMEFICYEDIEDEERLKEKLISILE